MFLFCSISCLGHAASRARDCGVAALSGRDFATGTWPMCSVEEEDTAPDAARVAARALALAAVTSRGMIECDDDKRRAEDRRRQVCRWLERLGVADELED